VNAALKAFRAAARQGIGVLDAEAEQRESSMVEGIASDVRAASDALAEALRLSEEASPLDGMMGAAEVFAVACRETNAQKIEVVASDESDAPTFGVFASTDPRLVARLKAVCDAWSAEIPEGTVPAAAFEPGPWHVEDEIAIEINGFKHLAYPVASENEGVAIVIRPKIDVLFGAGYTDADRPERLATARLCAAAPQLLEALEEGADCLDHVEAGGERFWSLYRAAREKAGIAGPAATSAPTPATPEETL